MSEGTVAVLPEQLRERDQWVCWREEPRDGKSTKIPVTLGNGEFVSSTDPDARDDSSEERPSQSESSASGSRDEPAQTHPYLVEKIRLLTDSVDDLETTLEEKDDRIADLEVTNEALREQLYVPVQTTDEVAVIDNDERDIVEQSSVGSGPNGATAASVRPDSDATDAVMGTLASIGIISGGDQTHCEGDCWRTPNENGG